MPRLRRRQMQGFVPSPPRLVQAQAPPRKSPPQWFSRSAPSRWYPMVLMRKVRSARHPLSCASQRPILPSAARLPRMASLTLLSNGALLLSLLRPISFDSTMTRLTLLTSTNACVSSSRTLAPRYSSSWMLGTRIRSSLTTGWRTSRIAASAVSMSSTAQSLNGAAMAQRRQQRRATCTWFCGAGSPPPSYITWPAHSRGSRLASISTRTPSSRNKLPSARRTVRHRRSLLSIRRRRALRRERRRRASWRVMRWW
ncbi:hypothetical protein C8F01DRAFT_1170980 [Mycena amicta]|nr:hypothetical protein C8F01DRAFT_1170980 [Mycena amicta]